MAKKPKGFVKVNNINQWVGVQKYDDYLRGELEKQKENNVVKTHNNLYQSFHCQRDNFTKTAMSYMKLYKEQDNKKDNERKAYTYTISFAHDDEIKNGLTPELAHQMSMEFANKYFKDYPTLAVTHVDTNNLHTQFLVANIGVQGKNEGKAWKDNMQKIKRMKETWGEILQKYGMTESIKAMNKAEEKKELVEQKSTPENKVYSEKSYHKSMAERQINKRGFASDKQMLQHYINDALNQGSKSFEEFQEKLAEHEITVTKKRNSYTYHYINKKGKERPMRDNNLAESLKDERMLKENIEKRFIENAELEKMKYMNLEADEKDKAYDKWRMINERNGECIKEVDQINEFNKKIDEAEKNNSRIKDTNKHILHLDPKDKERKNTLLEEKKELLKANGELKKQLDSIMHKYDEINERIKAIDKELEKNYPDDENVQKFKTEQRVTMNKREFQRVFKETDALIEMSPTGARERVTEAGAEQSNIQRKDNAAKLLENANKETADKEVKKQRVVPKM